MEQVMFTRFLTWTTLTMAFGGPLWAQQAYRQVSSSDLVDGYIGNGEWVETRGHLWFLDAGVSFAVNVPSAREPIPLNVANPITRGDCPLESELQRAESIQRRIRPRPTDHSCPPRPESRHYDR
jgi:hypothetical protein